MINLRWLEQLVDSFTLYGGGKGGGSSGSSQSTASIDPMLQPYVTYGLDEGQRLYQSDNPQYYPSQTYVSPSDQTQGYVQALQNRALQGNPLLPAAQATVGNLQTATNLANPMFSSLYNNAQTSPQLSQDVYSNLAAGNMANAANPLNQFSASGGFLGSNPYFNQAMAGAGQAASQNYFDAINQANSAASQAGRYGSGAQENMFNRAGTTLANTLANKAGELAYNQYGMERGLQENAIGRLGATSAQDIANRLMGAQSLTGVGQQQFANQMGAATGLANTSASDFNRQLAAAQSAPALAQADYFDINQLGQAGNIVEGYQQSALEDSINRFNFEQNLPQNKLNQFMGLMTSAPQGSSTTTTTSGGGKIVCTMMNESYGIGSFRNRVWLAHSASMPNAKTYEKGYHTLFLPLVAFAKKDGIVNRAVKRVLEHVAKHRTADLYKEMRGNKRDNLGRIYRAILEPICYIVGRLKGA
jgi:hypothetical protein